MNESLITNLKTLMENLETEMDKFEQKGVKAAAVRARKILQEIKKEAVIIRQKIQDAKQADDKSDSNKSTDK